MIFQSSEIIDNLQNHFFIFQKKNLCLQIQDLEKRLSCETMILPKVKEFVTLYLELKSKYLVMRSEHEDTVEGLQQDILKLGDFYDEELGELMDEFVQEKEALEERLEAEIAAKQELEEQLKKTSMQSDTLKKQLGEAQELLGEVNFHSHSFANCIFYKKFHRFQMKDGYEEMKIQIKDLNDKYERDSEKLKQQIKSLKLTHKERETEMSRKLHSSREEYEELKNVKYFLQCSKLVSTFIELSRLWLILFFLKSDVHCKRRRTGRGEKVHVDKDRRGEKTCRESRGKCGSCHSRNFGRVSQRERGKSEENYRRGGLKGAGKIDIMNYFAAIFIFTKL